MATNETFADRLTKLRENTGKKRQEVADELEISRASLEYYEKGKRKPDIEVLAKVAKYYGVSTDYLLGLSNAQTVDKDIQFICDYTGLSEKSVDVLHFYKSYEMIYPTINKLLESEIGSVFKELGVNEVQELIESEKYESVEYLQIVSALEQYLNLKKPAPALDKWLSISKSGKMNSLSETDVEITSKLTYEDLITVKTIKQSELVENVLFKNIIDKIKKLKQDGD